MSPSQDDRLRALAAILAKSQPTKPGDTASLSNPSILSQWLASMSAPPAPPVVQDRWFKDQTLNIDGYTFVRCRFDSCSFITEHASFAFHACYIEVDCSVFFRGPSLKIAKLLMHQLALRGRIQINAGEETIFPVLNSDNTFNLE